MTVESRGIRFSTTVLVTAIVLSLFAGGLLGYYVSYPTISERIDNLQTQLSNNPSQNVTYISGSNITYFLDENVSLSQLYKQVEDSVVIIRGLLVQYDFFGRPYYSQVQGSGFVYSSASRMVIVTNYHVVENAINITVTLADGDAYLLRRLVLTHMRILRTFNWRPASSASAFANCKLFDASSGRSGYCDRHSLWASWFDDCRHN